VIVQDAADSGQADAGERRDGREFGGHDGQRTADLSAATKICARNEESGDENPAAA
jgi:hypothetical protein